MPFTNTDAASLGLLVMSAMDMYRSNPKSLTPPPPDSLPNSGWDVVAYVTARDVLFGIGPLQLKPETVCYGYVARNGDDNFVVAIRGTDGIVEWLEDGEFPPFAYAPKLALPATLPPVFVEQGFWSIYASMEATSPTGAVLGPLANAVSDIAGGGGKVTVLGHSLGSALATYLTLDLARGPLGSRTSACLFASPRTGDESFVALFDEYVADYRLFNYSLDVVPRIPIGLGYMPLTKRTIIDPRTAEASIRFDPACNHHVVCYCAMLDYEGTNRATTPVPVGEKDSVSCILGPETGDPSLAKVMAGVISSTLPG